MPGQPTVKKTGTPPQPVAPPEAGAVAPIQATGEALGGGSASSSARWWSTRHECVPLGRGSGRVCRRLGVGRLRGGVAAFGSVDLVRCTLQGNDARQGGGVSVSGRSLRVTDCALLGNSADKGAGIFAREFEFQLAGCSLVANVDAFVKTPFRVILPPLALAPGPFF